MKPEIHGWAFSPFVRAVRMALTEKDVDYTLHPLTPGDITPDFRNQLSPFGRIPVFQHQGRVLIETPAILAYIDAAFDGPSLRPHDPYPAAVSDMVVQAASNYFYPTGVMGVFFGEAYVTANGGEPNLATVTASADAAAPFLAFLEQNIGGPWIAGATLSSADLVAGAMVHNFTLSETGRARLAAYPKISDWFARIAVRGSFLSTDEPIPLFGL